MKIFFLFVLVAITLPMGVYLYRVLRGPTVFDRVLGLNGISTKAIILLAVIGTVYDRVEMFVDISTGYAPLNLLGSLAIAKYLERKRGSILMFPSALLETAHICLSTVAIGLVLVGLYFLLVAAIGVLCFPDVYTRAHAVSLTDSLGALFLLGGLALYLGFSTNVLKLLIVLVLLYLLNPVIAHATVRAAFRSGLKPWSKEDK